MHPDGIEPSSRAFQTRANPSQLEAHSMRFSGVATHLVGLQGIEPCLPAPKAGALPVHDSPFGEVFFQAAPAYGAPRSYVPAPWQRTAFRQIPQSRTGCLLHPEQADYRLPRT